MGFDPLEAENWYFATFLDILSEYKVLVFFIKSEEDSNVYFQGAISVISLYGGFGETLQHLYPDVGFDERNMKVKSIELSSPLSLRRISCPLLTHARILFARCREQKTAVFRFCKSEKNGSINPL
jgi:hypothetical protein